MAQPTGWNIQTIYEDRRRDGTVEVQGWDLKDIWNQAEPLPPAEAKQFLIKNGLAPALAAALITLKTNYLGIGIDSQYNARFSDPIDPEQKYSITNKEEDTIIQAAGRVFNATFKRSENRSDYGLIGVRIYRVGNESTLPGREMYLASSI
ncbi:MAG: hypothetical protein HKM07_08285 [Chlamydiae bacterium]|jgi:hypothetical protein|nr:hypothetical protein [Chlamydiota bacterium]